MAELIVAAMISISSLVILQQRLSILLSFSLPLEIHTSYMSHGSEELLNYSANMKYSVRFIYGLTIMSIRSVVPGRLPGGNS